MTILHNPQHIDLQVSGIFLRAGKEVLFLHSASRNNWGAPAGKVDTGETKEQCAIREVFEETGVHIVESQLRFVKTFYCKHDNTVFAYHQFEVELAQKPEIILSTEHSDFCWATPTEALDLELIEDEDVCIKKTYEIHPDNAYAE
jgi:8-oxo-dGTP pyrophosphatase MutT (NUDIX family)